MADVKPTQFEKYKNRPKAVTEVMRLTPLIGVAGILLVPDIAGLKVVMYMIGILLLVAATSHLIRKILFPYLDLGEFVAKAHEDPKAAGMVFLGMSFILGVMIHSATELLK